MKKCIVFIYLFFYLIAAQTIVSFEQIAPKVLDAVVHVKTQANYRENYYNSFEDFFYGNNKSIEKKALGFGSGVIISQDGYIITNNHVIEGAEKIEITLNNKNTYPAKLIGADPSTDLALIKIELTGLQFLELGDSDAEKVGAPVLAVGNPLNLTSTITAGIISAKGRNIHILKSDANKGIFPIESFIQTDAAVNQGNSGGALVNTKGQMIGVITAIASTTGAYSGYSFAVPAKIVKKISQDLMKYGKAQRAFLGLRGTNIDDEIQKKYNLKDKNGVFIAQIEMNGGVSQAGLTTGDVIKKIADKNIYSMADLQEEISQYRPGNIVKINYLRGEKEISVNVTLKGLENNTNLGVSPSQFSPLGAELNLISLNNTTKGIRITQVQKNGKLASVGIEENFIITKINNKAISTGLELEQELKNSKADAILLQGFYPNNQVVYYALPIR